MYEHTCTCTVDAYIHVHVHLKLTDFAMLTCSDSGTFLNRVFMSSSIWFGSEESRMGMSPLRGSESEDEERRERDDFTLATQGQGT